MGWLVGLLTVHSMLDFQVCFEALSACIRLACAFFNLPLFPKPNGLRCLAGLCCFQLFGWLAAYVDVEEEEKKVYGEGRREAPGHKQIKSLRQSNLIPTLATIHLLWCHKALCDVCIALK